MRARLLLALSMAFAGVLAAGRARAAGDADDGTSKVDHRIEMWRFELGYKGSFVPDSGYDPFSTTSYLPQVSLAASRTVFARGRFSFAPGIAWDYGSSSTAARGDATSLTVHRLTIPLEGRYHVGPWGYAFVRGAPGFLVESESVQDASAPGELTKSRWVFATDASAGFAWLAWPWSDGDKKVARLWLQSDVGYGFAVRQRLVLSPTLPAGDVEQTGTLDLGSLVLRGAFFRVAAAVSF